MTCVIVLIIAGKDDGIKLCKRTIYNIEMELSRNGVGIS